EVETLRLCSAHLSESSDGEEICSKPDLRSGVVKLLGVCSGDRVELEDISVHNQRSRGGMMNNNNNDERTVYNVVVNAEDQYSIWPEHKTIPRGWSATGKRGTKAECLAQIKEVWIDMRPRSLRQRMDGRSAA